MIIRITIILCFCLVWSTQPLYAKIIKFKTFYSLSFKCKSDCSSLEKIKESKENILITYNTDNLKWIIQFKEGAAEYRFVRQLTDGNDKNEFESFEVIDNNNRKLLMNVGVIDGDMAINLLDEKKKTGWFFVVEEID